MELNIQISSPKGRLLNRLSSFPSNSSPLHSKGVPLSSDNNNNNNNNWWEWGGSNLSGVACMVISSISYSFMGLFVKLLSGFILFSNYSPSRSSCWCLYFQLCQNFAHFICMYGNNSSVPWFASCSLATAPNNCHFYQ